MTGGRAQPLLLLTSPLGDDTLPIQQGTLHAVELTAREDLSRPFSVSVTAVSSERSIQPTELVGLPVCVTLRKAPHADRYFNGIVRRLAALGQARRDRWTYKLEIVPRLWFLSQTMDCRIFQQKTVVEILQQIFSEHRVSPVEFRLYSTPPVREYTTQYDESDLVFVERLLQESGLFYFFEHSPSAHTLVISDRNQAFKPTEHPEHWVIHAGNNIDIFDHWCEAQTTVGAGDRSLFIWPAMTTENQIAGDRARYRIEAAEAAASIREGHGYDPEFGPGRRFILAKDPFTEAEGIEHFLHSVEHRAVDDTWITGGAEPHYENSFTCLLMTTPWRDKLTIGRPVMAGIFSAIVLGNAGEEIHADSIGRIKVRLLFDYRKETVAAMAIWARVMQPWSGNTWGWQHLPRVGTEVAVSFMNGDPDAPVIVGCFYNEEMRPVFPIPDQQTRQGFRSRSTLHGTTQEFSELSFDDKKGNELVFLHAQRDYTTEVERDQSLSVTEDRTVKIGGSETVTITENHSLTTKTGDISVSADASSVTISAATTLTLKVGETTIVLTPESISLSSFGKISISALAAVAIDALAAVTVNALAEVSIDALADVNIAAVGEVSIEGLEVSIVPPPDLPV